MKTVLGIAGVIAITACAPAHAGETHVHVEDVFSTVYVDVPQYSTQRVCRQISSGNSAGGDALAGMIIGGLLGKGVTGDDKGAALGAVMGGVVGADKSTGKTTSTQCRDETVTTYATEARKQYEYSTVKFKHNGRHYTLTFQK